MAKIKYEQNIQEKESMQKMEAINDNVHLAKEKSRADAEFYKIERSATANKLLLSKEYLELKKIEAMSVNNKVFITTASLDFNLYLLGLLWTRHPKYVHQ